MAIDTAEKRKSAGISRRRPGVTPYAAKDVEWRQQAGRGYSGILVASNGRQIRHGALSEDKKGSWIMP